MSSIKYNLVQTLQNAIDSGDGRKAVLKELINDLVMGADSEVENNYSLNFDPKLSDLQLAMLVADQMGTPPSLEEPTDNTQQVNQ